MQVFAWILFVLSALTALVCLCRWFVGGKCIFGALQALALTAYFVCYLFFFKSGFGTVGNWVTVGVLVALCLTNLLTRKLYGTALTVASIVFALLVIF